MTFRLLLSASIISETRPKYYIEPFPEEALISSTTAAKNSEPVKKGGTVTISVSVTDTKERKTMFGLTARHLIIAQSIESSADSCSGAGKSRIEFDGWYADFSADFSCPTG